MTSNTFSTPSSAKTLALARLDWNNSLRAIAENFYGSTLPTAPNYTLEGTETTIPNGVLYRSSTTGALYISDSTYQKGNPLLGGNWTRNGIGFRLEGAVASVNMNTYEIGEAFLTVGVSLANTRMYVKASNTNDIIDIGLPLTSSITTAMIKDGAITGSKIATTANAKFWSNVATSSGSNLFYLSTAAGTPATPTKITVWADGVFQSNTYWVQEGAAVRFKDASLPSGIEIFTQVLA